MRTSYRLTILLLLFTLASCRKEKATTVHPEFTGSWMHRTGTDNENYISIQADSKGYIVFDNHNGNYIESNTHTWFLREDLLCHGGGLKRKPDGLSTFRVETFPTISDHDFIQFLDTVETGDYYMVLDGNVYVR